MGLLPYVGIYIHDFNLKTWYVGNHTPLIVVCPFSLLFSSFFFSGSSWFEWVDGMAEYGLPSTVLHYTIYLSYHIVLYRVVLVV